LSLGLDNESANTVRTPNHSHGPALPPEEATVGRRSGAATKNGRPRISRPLSAPSGGGWGVAVSAGHALRSVAGGRLGALPVTLRFWDGSELPATAPSGRAPRLIIRSPAAIADLLHAPGQIGLTRAWLHGTLDLDGDLEAVLQTRERFQDLHISLPERARLALAATRVAGLAALRRPPAPSIEASLAGQRHTPARDRAAVRHHYDVSNDFYRLVLGPSMVYSCAYFAGPDDTLEAAQERKLDLICRKLMLTAGERFLDIGCGWGSLVLHAARNYGVRSVGVTLSEPQAELARTRIREAGLTDRVEIRVADYRELSDGPYDKIASVGMYEHVGRRELDSYVHTVKGLLTPGGVFLNHGIARLDSRSSGPDTFISRYVFPDGELHPIGDLISSLQTAGLELRDLESLREHYPLTLRRWATNLDTHRDEAIADAGEARERVWRLYMLASAQAFEAGEITVYQAVATKPGAPHPLPLDRTELLP
jgi:cyclopropane-fatty-acyl-phospholipid synthase